MSSAYWVLSRFFSTLIFEPETSSSSSSSSTTMLHRVVDYEVSESIESESEKPSFVFKFEYQTSGILKALEKVDEIGEYVVVKKSSVVEKEEKGFSFDEEKVGQGFRDDEVIECGTTRLSVDEVLVGTSCEDIVGLKCDSDVHCEISNEECDGGSDEKVGTTSHEDELVSLVFEEDISGLESDSGSIWHCEISHEKCDGIDDEKVGTTSHHEGELVSEEDISGLESDSGSIWHCEISHEKCDDGGDDEKVVTTSHEGQLVSEEDISGLESDSGSICSSLDDERGDFDDVDEDVVEELKELEELCKTDDQNDSVDEFEELNMLHRTWEHQELIKQLKIELKKVKTNTSLPTIPEESEYSDTNDSVPSKIETHYQHGDKLSVLQRFHKRYRERMRKFDKLNSKKLFEIGVLQSKYPLESFKKSATLDVKTFLDNFRLCRPKVECDGIDKMIRDVYRELEVVYVGQLCLSWEFLHWQYDKALELLESDTSRIRSYNEFAGELQQFQVLLQRFVEDEHYRGPRIENYVKTRRDMRNLLQVPAIREDRLKNGNAITIDIVVESLRESIRIIWQFIQADKTASATIACRKRTLDGSCCLHPKLLVEVQAELKNKQKKLKEIMRSENLILKRFQKHEEDEEEEDEEHEEEQVEVDSADHHHHHRFFTQVDIKLVSRVLNMSTVTQDQLIWCRNKLSKIHIAKRKVHVDPLLLLFPY